MASANGTCPCNEEEDVPMTNGNQAKLPSKISVVLGAQWGDEGKGQLTRFVDFVYIMNAICFFDIFVAKNPLFDWRSSAKLFFQHFVFLFPFSTLPHGLTYLKATLPALPPLPQTSCFTNCAQKFIRHYENR